VKRGARLAPRLELKERDIQDYQGEEEADLVALYVPICPYVKAACGPFCGREQPALQYGSYQQDQQDDDEDIEEDLGNSSRARCDPGESHKPGNHRNHRCYDYPRK
jgi:hypothetical protein